MSAQIAQEPCGTGRGAGPPGGGPPAGAGCHGTPPSAHTQPSEKNKKVPIRFVDIPSLPQVPAAVVRTRNRCAESADTPAARAPSDRGTNLVTREEYEALLARVVALETVTRNVTLPAKTAVTGVTRNASNAERQRRYRDRKRATK